MAQRRTINLLTARSPWLRIPQAPLRLSRHMSSRGQGQATSYKTFATQHRSLIITSLTLPFFKKVSPGSHPPDPALPSNTPIEISRIMLPDDTNPSGNVHGGTILKMIEHAGHIVANRHCNLDRREDDPPITTALVRLEKMDFHQPMLVGEVAQLQAAVTYTSPNSLEVVVDVWAENVISGERRHTNTAYLWYAGLKYDPTITTRGAPLKNMVTPIPPLKGLTKEAAEAGRLRYEAQKKSRKDASSISGNNRTFNPPTHMYHRPEEVEEHSVGSSQTTLANIVLPSDCTVTGYMLGGALMKMMDNAAGICATRHCRGQTVTACIDVINFHEVVRNGDMVFVTARMIFTSEKSMEIEVTTEAECGLPGGRHVTNTAYFTFVRLGEGGRAMPVLPLKLHGKEEEQRFAEGKARYLARKAARAAKKASQATSKSL